MDSVTVSNILKQLEEPQHISYSDGFTYARVCSNLLSEKEEDLARKIVIRILNNWDKMDHYLYPVWSEITESLGFYPYLKGKESGLEILSLDNEIRRCYHESAFLPNVTLHSDQKRISDMILSGENVALSAPTSFGKSLLIEEIVASQKYRNLIIIQPTLALLEETRIKLSKYSNSYKLILRTTQEYEKDGSNIFLLTAERVMEYEEFPKIDMMIIDEFYKISDARKDERVDSLNNAFIRIYYAFHPQLYFLGPNITSISSAFISDFNVHFEKTNYSMVDSFEIKVCEPNDTRPQKLEKLFHLLSTLPRGEQTLVYCSSPQKARETAFLYYGYLKNNHFSPRYANLPLIEWLKKEISTKWSLVKELEYGIAIHDSSMPKHLGASIIRCFNSHKLDVIFCTPTIIEGVNTSAKNVVLFSNTKGHNTRLDFFDVSNIKGRAGRLMEHYVGRVYLFNSEPPSEELSIDIPFADQNNNLSNEVLVNIPKENVKPGLREKYDELQKISPDFLSIIKRNGISITKQQEFRDEVRQYLNSGKRDILWKQIPGFNSLGSTLELLWKCRILQSDDRVRSSKQLCFFLNKYYANKTIIKHFRLLQGDSDINYDENLENAFYVQRRWFQYLVPKALRVAESIINYVCGGKYCSYSYYAQQLETSFLPENISLLLEYGIPAITIRKLERFIPQSITENELLPYIKSHDGLKKVILPYEVELIEHNL